jgi:hypothetical protein
MFGGPGAQGEGGPGNAFQEDESWKRHLEPVTPTYWLVAVRQNGNFELYSMPDFTLRCSAGFSQFCQSAITSVLIRLILLMGNWIQYFLACYEVKFLPVPYLSSDT